jgi:hypothetical protein
VITALWGCKLFIMGNCIHCEPLYFWNLNYTISTTGLVLKLLRIVCEKHMIEHKKCEINGVLLKMKHTVQLVLKVQ